MDTRAAALTSTLATDIDMSGERPALTSSGGMTDAGLSMSSIGVDIPGRTRASGQADSVSEVEVPGLALGRALGSTAAVLG
ncbi:hypothetical protein GCM10017556_23960 [Micromonospora sagamiensis]|nr:hypothetical protein GCM10017556_23960 [Micromonospora sagamiensis]